MLAVPLSFITFGPDSLPDALSQTISAGAPSQRPPLSVGLEITTLSVLRAIQLKL